VHLRRLAAAAGPLGRLAPRAGGVAAAGRAPAVLRDRARLRARAWPGGPVALAAAAAAVPGRGAGRAGRRPVGAVRGDASVGDPARAVAGLGRFGRLAGAAALGVDVA